MNFIQYTLINESDLEDLMVHDDAVSNIELLHEMEWKLRSIIDNQYKLNPKMYVNIIKRFAGFAAESYKYLSPKFVALFNYWLDQHQINDPTKWASNVYEANIDTIETEGTAFWVGFQLSVQEIVNALDVNDIQNIFTNEYGSILDAFPEDTGIFLQSKNIIPPNISKEELEELDHPWDYWEDNTDEASDYIVDNALENEYDIYAITHFKDNTDISSYDIPLTEPEWVNAIINIMYPQYYDQHGYNIDSVTFEIEEARDRLTNEDSILNYNKFLSLLSELHSDDSNLDDMVEKIMNNVGSATSAISLAMGVCHTTGNIMECYGSAFELGDVDKDFLDGFHDREIDDWRAELKKIIR